MVEVVVVLLVVEVKVVATKLMMMMVVLITMMMIMLASLTSALQSFISHHTVQNFGCVDGDGDGSGGGGGGDHLATKSSPASPPLPLLLLWQQPIECGDEMRKRKSETVGMIVTAGLLAFKTDTDRHRQSISFGWWCGRQPFRYHHHRRRRRRCRHMSSHSATAADVVVVVPKTVHTKDKQCRRAHVATLSLFIRSFIHCQCVFGRQAASTDTGWHKLDCLSMANLAFSFSSTSSSFLLLYTPDGHSRTPINIVN